MSAWMCNNSTISAVAYAIVEERLHTAGGFVAVSDVHESLVFENIRSLKHRYGDRADGMIEEYDHVTAAEALPALEPHDIRSLANCLYYQSCEHPEYESSPGCEVTKALIDLIEKRFADKGIDKDRIPDGPWGLTELTAVSKRSFFDLTKPENRETKAALKSIGLTLAY